MGAAVSYSSSSTTNKNIVSIVTNVIAKRASHCGGSTVLNTTQDLDISGSVIKGSKILQAVDATIDISCLDSSADDTSLQTDIAAQLKQYADSKTEANPTFLNTNLAISQSEVVSELTREIASNININSIKDCVLAYKASMVEKIRATNATITDSELSQKITSDVVLKCILSDTNQVARIDRLTSIIDQTSVSSAISGMSTLALIATIVAIVIICCSCSSAAKYYVENAQ